MAEPMTLEELDALIEAHPKPHAIFLSVADWIAVMQAPAGEARRSTDENGHPTYRGLLAWNRAPGASEVLGLDEARLEGVDRSD